MDRVLEAGQKGSIDFDGIDDYITVADNAVFNFTSAITVECWVRLYKAGKHQSILRKSKQYLLNIADDGTIRPHIYSGSTLGILETTQKMSFNVWNHVAYTYDGANIICYLNGSEIQRRVFTGTINTGTENVNIGAYYEPTIPSWVEFSKGNFVNLRVWNIARTAQEIKSSMYLAFSGGTTGLVEQWTLHNDVLGTNGNNGTTGGGVKWIYDSPLSRILKHGLKGSAEFDGVDDKITAPTDATYYFGTGDFTFEAWIKADTIGSTAYHIAASIDMGGTHNEWLGISSKKPAFSISGGQLTGTTVLKPNTWYHIAGKRAAGVIYLYLNGIEEGSLANTNTASTSGDFVINGFRGANFLDGKIAMVRVWSVALTQSQIKENMYIAYVAGTTGLLEQWVLRNNTLGTNGNNGTIVGGVSFTEDAPARMLGSKDSKPYMLSFGGTSSGDYVNFGNSTVFDLTATLSWEGWVYHKDSVYNQMLFNKEDVYEVGIFPDGTIQWAFRNTTPGWVWVNTGYVLPINTWAHIAVTYNNGVVNTYVNGALVHTYSGTGPIATNTNLFWLGNRSAIPTHILNGNLHLVRLWNTERTQAQIKDNMRKSVSKDATGLVDEWPLNQKEGTTVHGLKDVDGTVVGTKWNISTAPVEQRSGLKLDGNGYVTIPSPYVLGATDFSIDCWFNMISTTTRAIVGVIYATTTGWGIQVNAGKLECIFGGITLTSVAAIKLSSWTHMAVVRAAGVLKLYINGVYDSEIANTVDMSSISEWKLYKYDTSSNAVATISNLRVWDKALSQADVKAYMHRYLPSATANLIEQWKLNEGVGATIYGTKGKNGTVEGTAKWSDASNMNWVGKSVRFDGVSGKDITIAHTSSLNIIKDLTVEFLVNIKTFYTDGAWRSFVCKNENDLLNQFNIRVKDSVTGQFYFGNGQSAEVCNWNPSDCAPLGTWVHLAFVKDSLNRTSKVYANGVLKATYNHVGSSISAVTKAVVSIGRQNSTLQNSVIDASLDDVRIWNYARTQAEIQSTMYRTLDRAPGLVLNMGFETGYHDLSGYSNHGVATGSPVIEVTDNDKLLLNAPINKE